MESWKQSLDKYLTTPPDDDWPWADAVCQKHSDDFWEQHKDGFLESQQYYDFLTKLEVLAIDVIDYKTHNIIKKGYMTPQLAAHIIERWHRRYESRRQA